MPQVSRLEVIATGARRRWTLAEKRRIVAESYAVPRGASATARRHGLTSSQLFGWRKLAREGRLEAVADSGFAAAMIVPDAPAVRCDPGLGAGRMEISVGEARIVVDAGVDAVALARVVEVLLRSSGPGSKGG
jgi:transposase